MAETDRPDYRYLQARADAMAADEANDWAQLTGPAQPATAVATPDISMTMTPRGPTEAKPETGVDVRMSIGGAPPTGPATMQQLGSNVPNVMADRLGEMGQSALSGIGTVLKAMFDPPIADRVINYLGGTPSNIPEEITRDLKAAGVDESLLPGLVPMIEGAIGQVHGTPSFKGKTMGAPPQEAPAAKELLQGAVEPGATPRINVERLGGPESTKNVLAKVNQLSIEMGAIHAEGEGVVSHAQTVAGARAYGLTVEKLLAREPGMLLPDAPPAVQQTAARQLNAAAGQYLEDVAKRTLAGDQQAAAEMYDALALSGKLAEHVTEMRELIARGTESGKIIVTGKGGAFDPAAITEIAERLRMGGATVAQEGMQQAQQIDPMIVAKMILDTQTLAGARGVRAFTRQATQANGVGFTDMIYEAWINGLLSNPETHARNLSNGLLQAVFGIPLRAMASTMSRDPEGVVSGEAAGMLYALIGSFDDIMKIGWQSLRTGVSQFGGVQQVTHPPSISGMGLESASRGYLSAGGWIGQGLDLLGSIARVPSRLLMSADDMLKLANYRMELRALAVRDGTQQGKTGAALSQHIVDTIANPPPIVDQMARKYAAYSTYTDEYGKIGQWLSAGRELIPGGRWVAPFLRVATNIPKMAFEMSPGLNFALRSVREDLMVGGARRDLAVAKMALGSLMQASAAAMAAGGQLTGAGPVNPELNAIWRRTHQEYSFKFPGSDTWMSYRWMGPFGMVLSIPATMVEMGEGLPQAGWDQLAMAGALATAEVFLDQTWSKGLFDIVQAIREPETRGMDYLRTFARSFVPGLVGEVEKMADPSQASAKPPPAWFGYYDTRGQHQWEWVDALLAQWAARTPGFSSLLPPGRDVWGNVRSQSFGLKEDSQDPVDKELLRLRLPIDMVSSTIHGAPTPSSPFAEQDRPNVGITLSDTEYDEYVRLAGNELKLPNDLAGGTYGLHDGLAKFIASPHYKTLTDGRDGGKAFQIRRMVQMYRAAAQTALITKHKDLQRLVQQRDEERIRAKIGGQGQPESESWKQLLGVGR
jgi:hypothetical protein